MEIEFDVWHRTKEEFNRLSNLWLPWDLDKGRKKNVISGTTEWNGEPLPMKPKKI